MKIILLLFSLLFFPLAGWGQSQPHFYYDLNAEFIDLLPPRTEDEGDEKNDRINELRKKFQKKTDRFEVKLPTSYLQGKVLPKSKEKLWAFKNSKLIGTTRVTGYLIGMAESYELMFWTENPKLRDCLFVSVAPGTKTKDLPVVYPSARLTKEKETMMLGIIDEEWREQITPRVSQYPPVVPTPSATPTFTPTYTPTPTFNEKTTRFIKNLFSSESFTLTPTPTSTATISVPTATPTATVIPISWMKDAKNIQSFWFKNEKLEIFQATGPSNDFNTTPTGPYNVGKTICFINGERYNLRSIVPTYLDIGPDFWFAIKVMGKTYFVFSAGCAGTDAVIVCRKEGMTLKPIYRGEEAND